MAYTSNYGTKKEKKKPKTKKRKKAIRRLVKRRKMGRNGDIYGQVPTGSPGSENPVGGN